ncbi:GNAT family N-acetyltransferase [Lapidilactobacillus bayanensis]|uniref:GNAT family N-acetyltransferase n=1 Tax=Lapidilactobacillus bayanensis TaxID=2485998 RepID=UPI000F769FAE|nr:GNAT family N-acetyltransferase [Lapidilactobacillus bayanensis]
MQITSTTKLTDAQITTFLALQRRVHEYDDTHKKIYLSNQFNVEPTMAAFFIAEEAGEMLGLLMIYADEGPDEAAELSVIVTPERRREGIGTKLIAAAKSELAQFNYQQVTYVTERVFLAAHPDFETNWQLTDLTTEFQLSASAGTNKLYQLPNQYQLRLLEEADIAGLVGASVEAFDSTPEMAARYLRSALTDPAVDQYVLVNKNNDVLASTALDVTDVYYFFGLFVKRAFRHQGIGTALIQGIMAKVTRAKPLPFQLAVEGENDIAHHLYLHAGMVDETEIVYLKPQDNA